MGIVAMALEKVSQRLYHSAKPVLCASDGKGDARCSRNVAAPPAVGSCQRPPETVAKSRPPDYTMIPLSNEGPPTARTETTTTAMIRDNRNRAKEGMMKWA